MAFLTAGVLALQLGSAATFAVHREAESGQLAGASSVRDDAGASGGQSVLFGATGSTLPALPDPGTYNGTVDFGLVISRLDSMSLGGTVSGS